MTEQIQSSIDRHSEQVLPWWFSQKMRPVNDDFNHRAVALPQHALWQATQVPGIDLRVLEYVPGSRPRLTGQLRFNASYSPSMLDLSSDLEILIQRGELKSVMGIFSRGLYLRLPVSDKASAQELSLGRGKRSDKQHEPLALLYFTAGQMLDSDTELRQVNTLKKQLWLPGPLDGTEVLPLHGHGSGNVMMIRWTQTVKFKTTLDPLGEELLVLSGALHDEYGHYPAGTWIRNPVVAWQSWGATTGTVVYYKNGHLTDTD